MLPSDAHYTKPWVGEWHANGSVPVGKSAWKVSLPDDDLPGWVFKHNNDTGLNIKVLQTCDFNMTFEIAKIHKHGEDDWNGIFNSSHTGTITYCDIDNTVYDIIVVNKGSQPCGYVEMEVYIGIAQGICVLESLAKAFLKIFLIILFCILGTCALVCLIAVFCGFTACWFCCCPKKQNNYNQMANQNTYVQPSPNYHQHPNQRNNAPNQPHFAPHFVANQPHYAANQPNFNGHLQNPPQHNNQPAYQPHQGYVQPETGTQPNYPTQNGPVTNPPQYNNQPAYQPHQGYLQPASTQPNYPTQKIPNSANQPNEGTPATEHV